MLKKTTVKLLKMYQKILSPDTGFPNKLDLTRNTCRFFPTCSEYTIQAVEKYGVLKGLCKGFRRVLRCHPWQKGHIDILE